ncbi:hypothetical protein ONZ45_g15087 [Pleurotus djamor]|nr:hypothetical protein ONZ45_g15087 [Pleurotus djamor]
MAISTPVSLDRLALDTWNMHRCKYTVFTLPMQRRAPQLRGKSGSLFGCFLTYPSLDPEAESQGGSLPIHVSPINHNVPITLGLLG